jgi:hypothetical protein
MIYIRVGTNLKQRERGDKTFSGTTRVLRGLQIGSVGQYLQADMFGNSEVIRIEDWQGEKEREMLYGYLKQMQTSKNIFLIDETTILPATLKKLSTAAEKVFDCQEEKEKVDPFVLATLIQNKDKRGAWIELQRIKTLMPAEELQGVLFWKMKTMRNKNAMFDLINIRHEAHEGGTDLYDSLERLILKI